LLTVERLGAGDYSTPLIADTVSSAYSGNMLSHLTVTENDYIVWLPTMPFPYDEPSPIKIYTVFDDPYEPQTLVLNDTLFVSGIQSTQDYIYPALNPTSTLLAVSGFAIAGTEEQGQNAFVVFAFDEPSVLPTVTNLDITSFGETWAFLEAEVTDEGSETVTAKGFIYSTSPNVVFPNAFETVGSGLGAYSVNHTDFSENTTYFVRAYAISSAGTSYSDEVNFTTLATPPTPTAPSVSATTTLETTNSSMSLQAEVLDEGTETVTQRGFVYSLTANPDLSDFVAVAGSGIGTYSTNITGLESNTTYYVRAYATNSVNTTYGSETSIMTLETVIAPPPEPTPSETESIMKRLLALFVALLIVSVFTGMSTTFIANPEAQQVVEKMSTIIRTVAIAMIIISAIVLIIL